jgi:hypothetical protein
MQPRARRALRWAAGILAVIVLLGVAVVATLAAQFSGGWDEVFDTTKPLPGDPEVVAARAEGGARVDAERERVIGDVALPSLADGRVAQPALSGTEALASDRGIGLDSGCEVGSHNWKRDDPYDLYCVEIRRTVLAGTRAAFEPDMLALHAALVADGWTPREAGSGLPARLEGARGLGDQVPPPAGYRHATAPFDMVVSFQSFEAYTGLPPPTLAEDEYAVMVSINHESFLA